MDTIARVLICLAACSLGMIPIGLTMFSSMQSRKEEAAGDWQNPNTPGPVRR